MVMMGSGRRGVVFASTLLALAGLGLAVAACGEVRRPDGGSGLLPIGAAAPDLSAEDAEGRPSRLSDRRGRAVIVYFYPQDETPGCTKEACAFRDSWTKLQAAQVDVIGVSTNSAERHRTFQKKQKLPFSLAADESGAIGNAYGVSKKLWGYERVTFLVDRDGKVAKVWPSVDPALHADEVLREAAAIAKRSADGG
jgi:thioredoxin-dependent peroxiredoxin